MGFQEIVAPQIDVPGLDGIVDSGSGVDVLVEFPGMEGSYHGRHGVAVLEMEGIAQIFAVGEGIVVVLVDHPRGVGTPEQVAVAGDGTIHVEGRGEVGELEAVVQIERGDSFCTDIIPFADILTIAQQGAPIGTVLAGVEVDTSIEVVAQSVLEDAICLLLVDAGAGLNGGVAIHFSSTRGACIIRYLGNGLDGQQQNGSECDEFFHFGISMTILQPSR